MTDLSKQSIPDVCAVCLDKLDSSTKETTNDDKALIETECKHTFHRICFTTWLKQKKQCPTCRARVNTGGIEDDVRIIAMDDIAIEAETIRYFNAHMNHQRDAFLAHMGLRLTPGITTQMNVNNEGNAGTTQIDDDDDDW